MRIHLWFPVIIFLRVSFLYLDMQILAVLVGVQNTLRCSLEACAIVTWLNCEYDFRRCVTACSTCFPILCSTLFLYTLITFMFSSYSFLFQRRRIIKRAKYYRGEWIESVVIYFFYLKRILNCFRVEYIYIFFLLFNDRENEKKFSLLKFFS